MEIRLRYSFCPAIYIVSCIAVAHGVPAFFQADEESDWVMQADPIGSSSYPSGSSYSYSYYYSTAMFSDVIDAHRMLKDDTEDSSIEAFKSLNRLSGLVHDTHTVRRLGFRKMDENKDGYVTKDEYSLENPGVDVEIVRTLFDILDSDGDDKLTEEELVNNTNFWDTSEDCEVFATQQCDGRLMYTVELSEEPTDQQAMCQGLQAYLDCLASESAFCDFTQDFLQAVYTFADTYKTTKLCEHLVIQKLANSMEWDRTSKRKRRFVPHSTDPPAEIDGSISLECATSELTRCTTLFNRSLRETGDFCSTLNQYRHCVSHAARRCRDEILENLKESIMTLARLHRQYQVCDFN